MKVSPLRLAEFCLIVSPLTIVLFGCVVADGGYGYGNGAAIVPGYYEPYGAYYGGWGPNYYVAPYRNGYRPDDRGRSEVQSSSHAFRGAPASHSAPSIPSASRSGDSRSRRD